MKTIYLVRHAKSSWEQFQMPDFERPLNERGLRDAPVMGKLMAEQTPKPSLLISSPAKRAATTARLFAEQLGIAENEIVFRDEIYQASVKDIFEIVETVSNAVDCIAVFGHNPTMTDIFNMFDGDINIIDEVPTCGIVKIESSAATWSDFLKHGGKRTAFFFPKQVY